MFHMKRYYIKCLSYERVKRGESVGINMDFRNVAKKETELSALMNGREKISTEDVIINTPNGVTIVAVDIVHSSEGDYGVFHLKEYPNNFYCGGLILSKIAKSWLDEFGGDSEKCSEELAKSGGVKVKLAQTKTKSSKRDVTTVEVI